MLRMEKIDLNICRLCNENIGVTSLFQPVDSGIKNGMEMELCGTVMHCVNVKIFEGDGLPPRICGTCKEELTSTYRFILKCEETDKKLRSYCSSTKQERKGDVKIEKIDGSFELENSYDEAYEPFDIKDECNLGTEVRAKRKYVKRSDNKRKSTRKIGPSKCKVCNRVCNNPSTLIIHMRSHTNEKPHACISCDKRYKDGGSLKRHIERNHLDARERRFICEQCGKGFFSKSDCKIHMRTHTGEAPYACTKCPARFSQLGALQRHQLRHTGERSHMCSVCSKKFFTKEQLKKHYAVHTTEKKYSCSICETPFKYKNNLTKHIKMHTATVPKKFICNYCGRSYALKGNLQLHITKQHSSKSGYCIQCFKYVANIETHMWKHTGERPVKCDLCASSFFDLKGLSHHVNFRHRFTDKYKCSINNCSLKFPSQPMLDYHIVRYHESIKPFSCDKCPRCFYRKSDLARHKKGSHKERLI